MHWTHVYSSVLFEGLVKVPVLHASHRITYVGLERVSLRLSLPCSYVCIS